MATMMRSNPAGTSDWTTGTPSAMNPSIIPCLRWYITTLRLVITRPNAYTTSWGTSGTRVARAPLQTTALGSLVTCIAIWTFRGARTTRISWWTCASIPAPLGSRDAPLRARSSAIIWLTLRRAQALYWGIKSDLSSLNFLRLWQCTYCSDYLLKMLKKTFNWQKAFKLDLKTTISNN